MAGKTNYTENNLLNFLFRGVSFPVPGGIFVGLFTTAPTGDDGSGGVEVTGGSYARVSVARGTSEWKDPSTAVQGMTENVNAIQFIAATAGWGTVVAVGIWDASSSGNLLYFGNLAASKVVNSGEVFKFNAGDLEISED